jgi:hypothetical protein
MQALILMCLGLMAWQAWAEPRALGDWCWRLTPYSDTVLLTIYTADSLEGEPHTPLTFNLWWLGPPQWYSFSGGGTGTVNWSGGWWTFHAVAGLDVWGLRQPFFENPIIEFKLVVRGLEATGPWSARAEGGASYPSPVRPYELGGFTVPIDCAAHGHTPQPQLSVQHAPGQPSGLAWLQP